jgi:hypothetical protein
MSRFVRGRLALLVTCFATCIAARSALAATDFPRPLSADIPYDVDIAALQALNRDEQIPEAQRLFDIFAWQCFIALNWPAAADGSPDRSKTIADSRFARVWMSWRTNDSVFLPDGGRPQPWNPTSVLLQPEHYLWRFSKMLNESRQEVNELSASTQAFTGPLVDQNGVFVRYESYLNKPQFDYIVENELYNQDGQVAFSQQGKRVEFPANVVGPAPRHGSMGIKLAWKQLGPKDIRERFFVREAVVVSTSYDEHGAIVKTRSTQLMGLVGMHITALTQSSPTWIWATFEHVDNAVSNDLELDRAMDGSRVRVRPSFNNPDQPTKPVNVLPPPNAERDPSGRFKSWDEKKTTNPVQLTRVVPIPPATAELNRMVQALLGEQMSVFRNYELIGTQWPVQPRFPAFGGGAGSAPESIHFKIPGRVVPIYLVNTTMESYFQAGNQAAGPLEEDDRLPAGFFADRPTERITPDRTIVFGTESCAGCHFSAGAAVAFKRDENGEEIRDSQDLRVPIYGKNGSFGQTGHAGYVWQLQLKARAKVDPSKR